MKRSVVLLAKSAIAALPISEMAKLAQILSARCDHVTYAFADQGEPTLRMALEAAHREKFDEVLIVPLVVPMEPSFKAWMVRSVQRWRKLSTAPWPTIRIGKGPMETEAMTLMVNQLLTLAEDAAPVLDKEKKKPQGSVVPIHRNRVLICQGAPCNDGGAATLWAHLYSKGLQLDLKNTGEGTLCARASCLGTCNLAPVVQVYPDGTFYGGVDEQILDRIIHEHVIGGRIVEEFAYPGTGTKQRLRTGIAEDQEPSDGSSTRDSEDSSCH